MIHVVIALLVEVACWNMLVIKYSLLLLLCFTTIIALLVQLMIKWVFVFDLQGSIKVNNNGIVQQYRIFFITKHSPVQLLQKIVLCWL